MDILRAVLYEQSTCLATHDKILLALLHTGTCVHIITICIKDSSQFMWQNM